ncbi:MAG: isoaspartyl peptidase/L-asparaginase, partial [Psychroflexus halocasei]
MMKFQKIAILFNFSILLFFITSCAAQQQQNNKVAIVIHGGAGTILPESMTDSLRIVYQNKLEEAITAGHEILKSGGSAMEAVQKSINIMENSPLFNAGKGAVFTHDEKNSLDASIMDGNTLNAGAIAGVTNVKNPINLSYEV